MTWFAKKTNLSQAPTCKCRAGEPEPAICILTCCLGGRVFCLLPDFIFLAICFPNKLVPRGAKNVIGLRCFIWRGKQCSGPALSPAGADRDAPNKLCAASRECQPGGQWGCVNMGLCWARATHLPRDQPFFSMISPCSPLPTVFLRGFWSKVTFCWLTALIPWLLLIRGYFGDLESWFLCETKSSPWSFPSTSAYNYCSCYFARDPAAFYEAGSWEFIQFHLVFVLLLFSKTGRDESPAQHKKFSTNH